MPILLHPLNRFNEIERKFQSRQYSEMVFKYGFPCQYIKKADFDLNFTIGEYSREVFDEVHDIVCITRGIQEFTNQATGSKFGFEDIDTSTLYIDDIQIKELGLELSIGDIVYFPDLGDKIFEINFVTSETDKVKYHYGYGIGWQLDVDKYSLNLSDRFVTKDENINSLNKASIKVERNNGKFIKKQDTDQIYNIGSNPLLK